MPRKYFMRRSEISEHGSRHTGRVNRAFEISVKNMQPVLIDNSLCTLTIRDDASASDIDRYIKALAWTGVRYVEIDFRALMKLRYLPSGVGYIFRPVDPMFMRLADVFDFDYISLSVYDIMKYKNVGKRIMLSLPLPPDYMNRSPRDVVRCAGKAFGGEIASMRICGDFPLLTSGDAAAYIDFLRKCVIACVGVCPTSGIKTALNAAVFFMKCHTDSVTVTMGSPERYCSLEELAVTLLTMYGGLPEGMSMKGLCGAASTHTLVFKDSVESNIIKLVKAFENVGGILNADTGERVSVNVLHTRERRFVKSFADILKEIHCDWDIHGDDPRLREAAESASAELYKRAEDANKGFGSPFLN